MGQRFILLTITVLIFAGAVGFYALIIFGLLPPIQNTNYTKAAESLINGKLQPEDLLDLSPLGLKLHLYATKMFGQPIVPLQWLHIVLIALSICLFFHLLLRYFPLWLAVTGSICLIMQRSFIISAQALEPESMSLLFLLAFLYFVGSSQTKFQFLAGISLGAIFLVRADFSLLLLMIPIYFTLRNSDRSIALKKALICFIPAATSLFALWVRQGLILGYFSWSLIVPGTSIYEGNNPVAHGLGSVYPPIVEEISASNSSGIELERHYRKFARSITGLQLTSGETNRYWNLKAIHFLQDHPENVWRLLLSKLFHFFHEFQWHELPTTFWTESQLRDSGIPSIPFSVLSALALAGLWFGKKRWKDWLFFYAAILFQFLFIMIVYVSARYRVPLIPLFLFFAVAAIHSFVTDYKKLFSLFLVLPAVWLFYAKTDFMYEEMGLWQNLRTSSLLSNEAYAKRATQQWLEASDSASRSLAAAPFFLDSRRPASLPFETTSFFVSGLTLIPANTPQNLFDRGFLSLYANLPGQSEIAMHEVLKSEWRFKRDQYQSSQPLFYLGHSSWLRGNKSEAERRFRDVWKNSPGDPWNLAALYAVTRHDSFRAKLFRYNNEIDAHYFLGEAALELNAAEEAVKSFSYLVQKLPESRKVRILLAASLAKSGRLEEAENMYRFALQMSSDPAMREKEILELFRLLSERSEEDAEKLYMYGFVLRQFGHYQEALVVQYKALERSQAPAIRAEIAALQIVLSKLAASD